MKKIILLLLVCTLSCMVTNAQEQKQKVVTAVITCSEVSKYSYTLDLGELGVYKLKKDGKKFKTKFSIAYTISLMRNNGWTYVDYIGDSSKFMHMFIFEKKVNSDDEAKEGFELELDSEVIVK